MDTFLLKITPFEKTGSIGKTFISLGNLIINFHLRNKKSITFFVPNRILLFDSGDCLPFNNRKALNYKKSNRAKIKIEREQFLRLFPEKKSARAM